MYKLLVIAFFATVSALSAQTGTPASASTAFYVEPSVVIAFPGHFDNAVSAALALGTTIRTVHSIEVDVISFKTKEYSDDFRFTPLLATYKYSFALPHQFSVMAGASIGATFEKWDYYLPPYPGGGGGYTYSESQTAFTTGLVGGISYALSQRVSLDANTRLLRLEKTDLTTAGNMVLVTLGAKIRF